MKILNYVVIISISIVLFGLIVGYYAEKNKPELTCMLVQEGYIFDDSLKKCVFVSISACTNPFNYSTEENCELENNPI
jgi:hypothetical protein